MELERRPHCHCARELCWRLPTILDAVFPSAGPSAAEDMLGLSRKWLESLIYAAPQDNERKTDVVAVHVSGYWALYNDADGFVRGIVHWGRLAGF
jgi:hypothetical protein